MFKIFIGLLVALLSGLAFGNGDGCTPVQKKTIAPDGAQFQKETLHYKGSQELAHKGFDHLLGWMTVVTAEPCLPVGKRAMVDVKSFRIVEVTPTGKRYIAQSVDYQAESPVILTGMLFNRKPAWYVSGQPNEAVSVDSIVGNRYIVDIEKAPHLIWHPYTQPRIAINSTSRYFIEATVKIVGDARVQFGIDYWKGSNSGYTGWSKDCSTSNNCEAWLSDWHGNTHGKYVTIRSPRS